MMRPKLILGRKLMRLVFRRLAAMAFFVVAGMGAARAQSIENFYKNKQLTMIVYAGAGSPYDVYARLLAKYLPEYLPGKPGIIIQYMVGAGGLKAVDYMNRIAPRDGSLIGTIGRGLPFEPMLGAHDVNWDPLQFTWIGSMNSEASLAMSWNTSLVKTLDDLKKMELMVPGTGVGADSEIIPRAINTLAGTRFKIISGYKDTNAAALAMESGEIAGISYWAISSLMVVHPDWVRDKKINILFQTGSTDISFLPGLPKIRDSITDPIDRKALDFLLAREIIGRPFVAPPGLPADRTKALRDAFAASMNDPELKKDAARARMGIDLVTGEQIDALLKDAASSPPEVLERVKQALGR
jgi:tripartite-type tricarboxylate transporter receptor subunit TctC